MTAQRFRFRPSLAELPKGAERGVIAQFRAVQNDLDGIRGVQANAPPVITRGSFFCRAGELVRVAPESAATVLLTIPPGSPENISQVIRIALIGGVLSPGAAVSIVGRKGTINGQQTLYLNSHRLVELTSCGEPGWFFST